MNNTRYWIWLSLALGFDNIKIKRLYEAYNDISQFYKGKEFEWRLCGFFNQKELEKLVSTPIDFADKIISKCNSLGYRIIPIDSLDFPACLRYIDTPPSVIYVSGYLPRIDNILSIGIVGTRRASNYGKSVAYNMSYKLSKCKVTIVSGGALGVDSSAHTGALNADGITICVLGCGIDYPYLTKSEPMRKAITKRGCLISEYPPGTEPLNYHFPSRNRIISALSNGILVIEAGKNSGSLITAKLAGEQGKDVFAVMANINSVNSMGSNELIKDGAVPVTTYTDILSYYNKYYSLEVYEDDDCYIPDGNVMKIPSKKSVEKTEKEFIKGHRFDVQLDDDESKVYHIVKSTPVHIDEIAMDSGIPVFKITRILTSLEVKGLIENLPGRLYKLK